MAVVQLQELHGRVAAHNANKAMLIVDPHWDKVTVFNTEVINSNLQALAHVLAPSLQLATCKPRFAQHAAAANDFIRTERVDFWYKGATENTEIINANLIALGQVMAPAVQLTAVVDNVAKYPSNVAGPRIEPGKQMWDKFTTSNTETINVNLHALALAQAAASAEKWLVSCNLASLCSSSDACSCTSRAATPRPDPASYWLLFGNVSHARCMYALRQRG